MTGIFSAWRRQTNPQRVDLFTRWTLYLLLTGAPLIALSVTADVPGGATAAFLAATTAQTVTAIAVVRGTLAHLVVGTPLSRPWLAALTATTLGALGVALLGLPLQGDAGRSVRSIATLITLSVALLAVSTVLGTRVLLVSGLAVALVIGIVETAAASSGTWVVATLCALVVWGTTLSFRISGWMLAVVWEQDRARTVHARLAVAEERLRFSRDLHDVVGRTLSAIAVKSELAAELARRGQEGAVDQMLDVRQLAQESLREVRGVVSGLRTADLAAELTGARSVLRSAGIDTRVIGEDARLPDDVQRALAWVVREAVTNVVRHAHARRCTIDLDVVAATHPEPGPGVVLTVTNDGAPPRGSGAPGSGLVGLTERLAEVGGSLSATADDGVFTLRATVPVPAADSMAPR